MHVLPLLPDELEPNEVVQWPPPFPEEAVDVLPEQREEIPAALALERLQEHAVPVPRQLVQRGR